MAQQKKPGIARRAAVGTVKAWSYSIGLTSLAGTASRIGGNALTLARFVRRTLKDGPQNYRHETFEEAVERLGLSDAQLIRRARLFSRYSMSWFAGLMLAALWMAGAAWSDAPIQHVLLCFATMFLTSSKVFTYRFRYCQIRDQELYAFGPWLRSPSRW